MLESKPTSGESAPVFTDLVYDLRRQALNGADVLELLSFSARKLSTLETDLGTVVSIGPNTEAVFRLALVFYLDLAFGVASHLSSVKNIVWDIYPEGDSFASTNQQDVDIVNRAIDENRIMWCNNLGNR